MILQRLKNGSTYCYYLEDTKKMTLKFYLDLCLELGDTEEYIDMLRKKLSFLKRKRIF